MCIYIYSQFFIELPIELLIVLPIELPIVLPIGTCYPVLFNLGLPDLASFRKHKVRVLSLIRGPCCEDEDAHGCSL